MEAVMRYSHSPLDESSLTEHEGLRNFILEGLDDADNSRLLDADTVFHELEARFIANG